MFMLSKHTSPKVNKAKFMKFMYTSRVFCDDTRMWTCADTDTLFITSPIEST